MSEIVKGDSFGVQLCEALGLDKNDTKSIVLRAEAGNVATAEVTMFIRDDKANAIAKIVKSYELRNTDADNDKDNDLNK